ncbi:MAG: lipoate--protein ligase [Eubacteriales bacterium]
MKLFITYSNSYDPYVNLAFEEALLNAAKKDEVWLYLWQNERTVVIGRHQNPWNECKVDMLHEEKGRIARRTSGGGAVFHDLGNLNFSFIVGKPLYDLHKQLSVIIDAVNTFGISAEFTGRNDITVDGHKFSGNAFAHAKNASLHHGTLLIDVNKENLGKYLNPSQDKLKSKGVQSVKSRICNLNEYGDISIESAKEALAESFEKTYENKPIAVDFENAVDQEKYLEAYARQKSKEWIFGKTPKFDTEIYNRFPWGSIKLLISLEKGKIAEASCYSDAMEVEFIDEIENALLGVEYGSEAIYGAIAKIKNEKSIELAEYLKNHL